MPVMPRAKAAWFQSSHVNMHQKLAQAHCAADVQACVQQNHHVHVNLACAMGMNTAPGCLAMASSQITCCPAAATMEKHQCSCCAQWTRLKAQDQRLIL